MDFEYSERTMKLRREVEEFMDAHIYPNEDLYYEQLNEGESRWETPPILEELKVKARAAGLWNMFLPESERGAGLTNMEYTPLCEIMGKVHFAGEVFNCSAPDMSSTAANGGRQASAIPAVKSSSSWQRMIRKRSPISNNR
jgi:acyl-CoA dehydrogenase